MARHPQYSPSWYDNLSESEVSAAYQQAFEALSPRHQAHLKAAISTLQVRCAGLGEEGALHPLAPVAPLLRR
jgi:hypothetical protein